MSTQNVIIVTSGRVHTLSPADWDVLLRSIRQLKKSPVLVLGPDGDDLLRVSQECENCEIIFDPNFTGDFFSSVKAGLEMTENAAFVLVVGEAFLPVSDWPSLEKSLDKQAANGVYRLWPTMRRSNSYPCLLTKEGVRALRKIPAATPWSDNQIILTSAFDAGSEIASSQTENLPCASDIST